MVDRYNANKMCDLLHDEKLPHSNARWKRMFLCHNSSSSSILVSMVGMFPSELARPWLWASMSAWPKLLRTLSSKPGNEARCFLYGEAIEFVLGSPEVFAAAEDDASPVDAFSGAGVPERGDPVESEWEGPAGRPRGSAEC